MDPQAAFADAVARARQVFDNRNEHFSQDYMFLLKHASVQPNLQAIVPPRGHREKARGWVSTWNISRGRCL